MAPFSLLKHFVSEIPVENTDIHIVIIHCVLNTPKHTKVYDHGGGYSQEQRMGGSKQGIQELRLPSG